MSERRYRVDDYNLYSLNHILWIASRNRNSCVRTVMSAILLLASCQATQAQLPGPNDTFARAGLSAKEVREIVAAVEASAYDNADSWTSELHVKRVTLGRAPGLIVRGTKLLCGATGNCQTW